MIATSRERQASMWPGVEWQQLDLGLLAVEPAHFAFPGDIDVLINAAGLWSVDAQALSLIQDRGARVLFDQAVHQGVLRPSLVLGAGGTSSAWLAAFSPWPLIPLLDLKV
ncbi:hypothetical protein QFZ85_002481 [Pseudomonas frederiksbergensis]